MIAADERHALQARLSKPVLGLLLGSTLGLLDGLSGFFYPSLGPIMAKVIAYSLVKGVASGIVIGVVSQRLHSLLLGIVAGVMIGAGLSYLVVLIAGPELFWDIMLPGMLLGMIVGFATQKFGGAPEPAAGAR
jgi:hypothetical protein